MTIASIPLNMSAPQHMGHGSKDVYMVAPRRSIVAHAAPAFRMATSSEWAVGSELVWIWFRPTTTCAPRTITAPNGSFPSSRARAASSSAMRMYRSSSLMPR